MSDVLHIYTTMPLYTSCNGGNDLSPHNNTIMCCGYRVWGRGGGRKGEREGVGKERVQGNIGQYGSNGSHIMNGC